jgi:molybdopterin-binding protein
MKLSARNQLKGRIVTIKEGAVNAIVVLDIGGGNQISATISMDAVKELNLKVGSEAYAVIKATSVMIGVEEIN